MTGHTNFLQSLGWAVLNSLWQLALLWVAYQLITAIYKSAKSSFRSSLASGLLIAGFAWFVFTFFSFFNSSLSEETVISTSFITADDSSQMNNWIKQMLPVASVIYLVLLAMPLLRFIRNYRYVQVIRKYGLVKINAEWRVFINNVSNRMGIKKHVSIWISELISSPVTIGFLKPVILVPLAAINNLSPQQLEAVLLHELSHIRRYDYLVNFIINIVRTILYFNPFVKAFVKIVERERETSCDEMVLQFQYDSHEYAAALLTLEKVNHTHKPLIIGAVGNKNDLLNRVELIMGVKKKNTFSANKLTGLIAVLFFIVGVNILMTLKNNQQVGQAVSFAKISLPVNFTADVNLTNADESNLESELSAAMTEHFTRIQNKIATLHPERLITAEGKVNMDPATLASFANFEMPAEPVILKKYQEQQVKQALEASKKVISSQQWKEVEKNLAEVFTQKEKQELKETYQKALNKFDWSEWENKLRVAYDQVNWDKVNNQLSNAVTQLRIDSIQKVYSVALSKLDMAQKELAANNIKGIPDTDVTLKEIEQRKRETQRVLTGLKAIRSKKVVHL